MLRKSLILPLVLAAFVAGCGSSDPFIPGPIIPNGESSLYDPVNNPTGLFPRRGSGAVMMLLESQAGPRAPVAGDTATVGVDEVWFEVTTPGFVEIQLDNDSLAIASRVEIRDSTGALKLLVDADHRQGRVDLPNGRYFLRMQSASLADPDPANVLVWFGESTQVPNPTDYNRVMQNPVNCTGCDLRGANLGGASLAGANLTGADMRGAMLSKVSGDGFAMSASAIFKLFLSGAQLGGADLRGANLTGANLTGAFLSGAGRVGAKLAGANLSDVAMPNIYLNRADLSGVNLSRADVSGASLISADLGAANLSSTNFLGANLRGANLSGSNLNGANLRGALLNGADLSAANLSDAKLSGAIWTDGRQCAEGSVGACN